MKTAAKKIVDNKLSAQKCFGKTRKHPSKAQCKKQEIRFGATIAPPPIKTDKKKQK